MKNLLKKAAQKAEQAEVLVIRDKRIPLNWERSELQSIKKKDVLGVALRLVKNGRLGFATTTSLEDTGVIEQALNVAQFGEETAITFPAEESKTIECRDRRLSELDEQELVPWCRRVLDMLAGINDAIVYDLQAEVRNITVEIGNTGGLHAGYDKTVMGGTIFTRSPQGFYQVNSSLASSRYFDIPEKILENLVMRHQLAQNRINVPTRKMPVIFAPSSFGALMLRLVAGIHGSYINMGISPLKDKMGEKIFDEELTVTEDPHRSWGVMSCPIDDEGVPTKPRDIVKDGVLSSFIHDLKTAREAGVQSTGNGFKRGFFGGSITQTPSPGTTNLVIPHGTKLLAEIIASVDEGILVETVMGAHTGNIPAGEFSVNIHSGFYIKNGKLQGRAVDAMVAGNIYEALQTIGDRSLEVELMTMFSPMGYCPYILLPEISVTGKG